MPSKGVFDHFRYSEDVAADRGHRRDRWRDCHGLGLHPRRPRAEPASRGRRRPSRPRPRPHLRRLQLRAGRSPRHQPRLRVGSRLPAVATRCLLQPSVKRPQTPRRRRRVCNLCHLVAPAVALDIDQSIKNSRWRLITANQNRARSSKVRHRPRRWLHGQERRRRHAARRDASRAGVESIPCRTSPRFNWKRRSPAPAASTPSG